MNKDLGQASIRLLTETLKDQDFENLNSVDLGSILPEFNLNAQLEDSSETQPSIHAPNDQKVKSNCPT